MTFDIGQTSGTVFGIVGMGIGLGVLAGTARMVMRSTERMYEGGYRNEKFGMKDASQRGWKTGGRGRYRTTTTTCRHPEIRRTTRKKTTTKKRKKTSTKKRNQTRYTPRYETQRGFYNPYTSNIKIEIPRW